MNIKYRYLVVFMLTMALLLNSTFSSTTTAWGYQQEDSITDEAVIELASPEQATMAGSPDEEQMTTNQLAAAEAVPYNGTWIIKWQAGEPAQFRSMSEVVSEYAQFNIVVARPAEGYDQQTWLAEWTESESIEYIQRNHIYQMTAVPNDPLRTEQKYLQQIHAEEAWDIVTENRSLTIAIVDTGVDLNHPDLKDNLIAGVNLINPRRSAQDDNGHGTNIAGVIAAVSNNKQGISGLARKTKLMPIKALEASGEGDEDKLGEGIRYAVDQGVKIVVLSVGLVKYSPYMKEIVQYAEDHDVLLVGASGNSGRDVKYPAAYATVLAVGGVSTDNRVMAYSNYGPEMDVVAPWNVYTTRLGGGYMYNEGTSMAAPQVAAVAALAWAKYPGMKPYQIRNLLRQTTEDIESKGWNPHSGYGLLRADRALQAEYKVDMFEPNDRKELAKPLPIDSMITASLSGSTDKDWFKLQAPNNGQIGILLEGIGNQAKHMQMTHYTADNPRGKVYTNITSKTTLLDVTKGQSWIEFSWGNVKPAQEVEYKVTTQFHIYRDAFEDNDRQYKAYTLPVRSQTIVGTFHQDNDQDWFMMQVEQPGTLSLELTADTARMDLALMIQKKGEKPYWVDEGQDGEAEIPPTIDVLPGSYYFMIQNDAFADNTYAVTGEYTFSINYVKKFIDPYEPNDKPYQATTIAMDTDYLAVLDTAADLDWYTFKVKSNSLVKLDLSQIPIDRLMSLKLFDQNQKQLLVLVNELGKKQLHVEKALSPGTYYIRLSVERPFSDQRYKLWVSQETLTYNFTDITGHWAEKSITQLAKGGVITGYGNFSFYPDRKVTRAEAVTMIVNALKLTEQQVIVYKDVSKNHWAYVNIAKASKAGIASGYFNGTFAPDRKVNRVEMAMMIANALGMKGKSGGISSFKDIKQEHWAADILRQMTQEGWISGYADGTFRADKLATRAEFAILIAKLMSK